MATSKPDVGAFARDLVVKAFDALADKVASSEAAAMSGLQKLADSWQSLTDEERQVLASQVTTAAKVAAAALPVAFTAARKRVRSRIARKSAAAAQTVADIAEGKKKKVPSPH